MTKPFAKFVTRERIASADLIKAIWLAEAGSIDADLGGGVIKQRIARQGEGKSGGYRTVNAFRSGARAIFLFGFPKNEKANIRKQELTALKMLAADLLTGEEVKLDRSVADGSLIEIDTGVA